MNALTLAALAAAIKRQGGSIGWAGGSETDTRFRSVAFTPPPQDRRRNQLRHPNHAKLELLATRPNELWSWDITKLLKPAKWTYYYLYVILDVFSRYVVGWMVAHREMPNWRNG